MKTNKRYAYSAEGHLYMLQPDLTVGVVKIRISGCGIYSIKGEYLGYWDRSNMPKVVLEGLLRFAHYAYAEEIARRQAALKKSTSASWLK
jgi:hypothetical protein